MNSSNHNTHKKLRAKLGSIWLGGFPGAKIIENLAQRKRAWPNYDIVLLLDESSERTLKETTYGKSLQIKGHSNGILDAVTDISVYGYLKNAGVTLERYELMIKRVKEFYLRIYQSNHEAQATIKYVFSKISPILQLSSIGFGNFAEMSDVIRMIFLTDSESVEKGVIYFDADLSFREDIAPKLGQQSDSTVESKLDLLFPVHEKVGFKIAHIQGTFNFSHINNNIIAASKSSTAIMHLFSSLQNIVRCDKAINEPIFIIASGSVAGTKTNLHAITRVLSDLNPKNTPSRRSIKVTGAYKDIVKMLFLAQALEDPNNMPLSTQNPNNADVVMVASVLKAVGASHVSYNKESKAYTLEFYAPPFSGSKASLHIAFRWYFPIRLLFFNIIFRSVVTAQQETQTHLDVDVKAPIGYPYPIWKIPAPACPLFFVTDKNLKKIGIEEDVSHRALSWASPRNYYARNDALVGEKNWCSRPGLM